ncbi:MAG: hypothetical protein LBG81_00465 [Coriobacteriaceae bacterium]|jgi:hypothetical protein|nr:hypothetical protein [Coriobacteriaceae bacterium]
MEDKMPRAGEARPSIAPFPPVPAAKVFWGTPYTGKTHCLVQEAALLLQEGVAAADILVLCASPVAADAFRSRLLASSPIAHGVEVTTSRAFLLGLLGTEGAIAATGRKPRLLLPFEYDFFLEDLKTSGLRNRRLREMLKFFYKGMGDMADDDAEWLITNEERELFGLMKECLEATAGILGPEVSNLAVKYLRTNRDVQEQAQRRYVLVDDFHLIARASQFASCLLAKEGLFLAADLGAGQNAAQEAYEAYPYPGGADEFVLENPHADIIRLSTSRSCPAGAKASEALQREAGTGGADTGRPVPEGSGGIEILAGENPKDELAQLARAVARIRGEGTPADGITIAAPHPVWRRNIKRRLEEEGIPAETLPDTAFLKGDIRFEEKCLPARFMTLLNLVGDPTDAVAWRCWCGFGDYLTNSNGIRVLRALCKPGRQTLEQVLDSEGLLEHSTEGIDALASVQRVFAARDLGRKLVARLGSLKGSDLLKAIAQELSEISGGEVVVPKALEALASAGIASPGQESAEHLACRLRDSLQAPAYSREEAVRIASYQDMAGTSPSHLYLAGFMNGFFPEQDYFDATVLTIEQMEKRYAKDLGCIASVAAKASDALTVSYCKKLDLEDAERLKLRIGRIVFEDNRRVAKTEPSIFLRLMDT